MGGVLGHLPRIALIELMLGHALSAATVLWTEVGSQSSERCTNTAEELVDIIVEANVQLDGLRDCLRKAK